MVEPDRPHIKDDNIIRRMRFSDWITKATDKHSEYVMLIAFARQQWLRERASMLRLYLHRLSWFCWFPYSWSKTNLFFVKKDPAAEASDAPQT
jgi:hypothetical protein